jgi:hypothetical protein
MDNLEIVIGPYSFLARLERQAAPKTCAAFAQLLPFSNRVIHSRWSGEAVWIPLGDFDAGVGFENHTSHPAPGEILLYPGGLSETEILLAYGSVCFSSKVGQLAGNHFLTITGGAEHLKELGLLVLWEGAQEIRFEAAPAQNVSGEGGDRTPRDAEERRGRGLRRRPTS